MFSWCEQVQLYLFYFSSEIMTVFVYHSGLVYLNIGRSYLFTFTHCSIKRVKNSEYCQHMAEEHQFQRHFDSLYMILGWTVLNACLEAFALTEFSEILVWQLCHVVKVNHSFRTMMMEMESVSETLTLWPTWYDCQPQKILLISLHLIFLNLMFSFID